MNYQVTKFGKLEEEIREQEEEAVPLPFIVDNFLGKSGGEVTGSIDMTGQPIKNLPDPIDGGDAVNKNYVDTSQGHSFFRRSPNKGYVASKDLDMDEHRLLNLRMPVDNLEAANKLFTEITVNDLKNRLENNNPFFLNTNKHKARSGLDMQNFKIEGLPMPVNDKDASNKIYVDTLTEDRKRKLEANNPFTFQNGEYTAKGKLNLRGFKIENVENPENPKDVVNLEYFKTNTTHAFLRKNGGFEAQEHIYLKNKKLAGLRDPVADREAVNKKYVDDENKKVKDGTINKFTDGVNYEADANFNLNNFRLFGVPDPQREDEITNKKYVDEKTANIQPAAPGVDAAALDKVKTDLEKNQAFNTRNQKAFNARGNINMKQKTIRNLPEPTDNTDAATKGDTDEIKELFEDRIKEVEDEAKEAKDAADRASRANPGGGAGNGGNGAEFGDMKGVKLVNVGDPENPGDGANKKYIDSTTPFTKTNGYFTSSAGLNMNLKKITNLNTPTAEGDASNKKYVDDSIENIDMAFLRRNGGFLALDSIHMNSNRIKNVDTPQAYDDATTKQYTDNKIKPVEDQAKTNKNDIEELRAFHVSETTQNKNMRGFKIVNVGQPEDEQDATNKNYVENKLKDLVKIIVKTSALSTSLSYNVTPSVLIRGEIEGPIIGVNEVKNLNLRLGIHGGHAVRGDKEGPILPSIVYFGANDGGSFIDAVGNIQDKIIIKPNYLIPVNGVIYGIYFTALYDDDSVKKEHFKIVLRINEYEEDKDNRDVENIDLSRGIIETDGTVKEFSYNWSDETKSRILTHCPKFNDNKKIGKFKSCSSLIMFFDSSHPKIKKMFITLFLSTNIKTEEEIKEEIEEEINKLIGPGSI